MRRARSRPWSNRPKLPQLLAESPIKGKGADRFQYHLAIEDESGRREPTLSEDPIPEALRSLVDRVKAAGRAA